jgi:hypothetical protein
VSNALPCVVTVTVPLAGAVQRYQIEAATPEPPWLGSPASRVALAVDPDVVPVLPVSAVASAKLSLVSTGAAVKAVVSVVAPRAPPQPSIAIAYAEPRVTVIVTLLQSVPLATSSFCATVVSASTLVPV